MPGTRFSGRRPKMARDHVVTMPGQKAIEGQSGAVDPALLPVKPAHITGEAQREWKRRVAQMQAGEIRPVEAAALAAYCQLYRRWVQASLNMDKLEKNPTQLKVTVDGSGQEHSEKRKLPEVDIELNYYKELRAWVSHFGWTPATRAKVPSAKPAAAGNAWGAVAR